jgi:predicted nucleic acid-binding protein
MEEFQAGVALGRVPETDLDWLAVLPLSPTEEKKFQSFLQHLNRGEAACLAVAAHRPARFLTDDRDARTFAGQRGIAISGTLGVLIRLVNLNQCTAAQADALLRQMIKQGYRSPVESITELL